MSDHVFEDASQQCSNCGLTAFTIFADRIGECDQRLCRRHYPGGYFLPPVPGTDDSGFLVVGPSWDDDDFTEIESLTVPAGTGYSSISMSENLAHPSAMIQPDYKRLRYLLAGDPGDLVPVGFEGDGMINWEEAGALIDELRDSPGAQVTICADHPEHGCAVLVCDNWTQYHDKRFSGESVQQCLKDALAARAAKKRG